MVHQDGQLLLHQDPLPAEQLDAGAGCLHLALPVAELAAGSGVLRPGAVRVAVVGRGGRLVAAASVLATCSSAVAAELEELFWAMVGREGQVEPQGGGAEGAPQHAAAATGGGTAGQSAGGCLTQPGGPRGSRVPGRVRWWW
jgi:hypothetical protein